MWRDFLRQELEKDYFQNLMNIVKESYRTKTVFPPYENLFECFKACPEENLKIVILGQDPYINVNEAHGLCFSTKSKKFPPSLVNILNEINDNFQIKRQSGDLTDLAEQGILFLNTILTVESGRSLSHQNLGWETFTLNLIHYINQLDKPIIFMLWGSHAKSYAQYLTNPKFLLLKAVHPSPLSFYRGYSGCNHFKIANEFLRKNHLEEIHYEDQR